VSRRGEECFLEKQVLTQKAKGKKAERDEKQNEKGIDVMTAKEKRQIEDGKEIQERWLDKSRVTFP
jgi:hypothetical protein